MNLESDIQVLYQQHRVFDKTYIFVYYKEKFIVMTKTEYLQLRATINQFYGQVVSRYRFSIIRWGVIFLLLASPFSIASNPCHALPLVSKKLYG